MFWHTALSNPSLDVTYTDRDTLLPSRISSPFTVLTDDTHYLINPAGYFPDEGRRLSSNTSRGALIDTAALIEGLADKSLQASVWMYTREEDGVFYEDRSTISLTMRT